MHPKIKNRPAASTAVASPVRPLMLHDVTNRQTPASAASLRRLAAMPADAGHARHHVSRHTQA